MLKSCKYCGRIHDSKIDCGKKPKPKWNTNPTKLDKFRWTKQWQIKRNDIRDRDKHVCQVCVRRLYDSSRVYETECLSVHHAIPLHEDWDKRLDNDNLITLCSMHHEMAEKKEIPYKVIKKIIDEQENTMLDDCVVVI